MPRRQMQGDTGGKVGIAVIQFDPALEVQPHHPDHIFHLKAMTEVRITHMAASGKGEFALLQMEAGVGQFMKIADMVVVQMGQHYVSN